MFELKVLGASSDRVTPVPISNTAVKPIYTDDSRKAKVGRCREPWVQTKTKLLLKTGVILFLDPIANLF